MKALKMAVVLGLGACILGGCSQLKGKDGTNGTNGQDATARTYEGRITSDNVNVSVSLDLDNLPVVEVYASIDKEEWVELSVVNMSTGGNAVAVLQKNNVQIAYGYSNWLRYYYIVVASYPSSRLLQ